MILTLYRDSKGTDSTIGRLCIGSNMGEHLIMFTVEDQQRVKKVAGETRIPAGTYEIGLKRGTPMANRYDNQHHSIGHDGMLHIRDVPWFTDIYIHKGNTHEDSAGCILVNFSCTLDVFNGGGFGGRSTQAYEYLYPKVKRALDSGEKVLITIKDEGVR